MTEVRLFTLLLSCIVLLSSCGGASESSSGPTANGSDHKTSDPAGTHTPAYEWLDKTSVRIANVDGKTRLTLISLSDATLNYQVYSHPLPHSGIKGLSRQQTLTRGHNSLTLESTDISGQRLYFYLSHNHQQSDVMSIVIPIAQSQAVSTLTDWHCPTTKTANTTLQVPAYLVDVKRITQNDYRFTLTDNPQWRCDWLNNESRTTAHSYLQNLRVSLQLSYRDRHATETAQSFELTFSSPEKVINLPPTVTLAELDYYSSSRFHGIATPTLIAKTVRLDHQPTESQ